MQEGITLFLLSKEVLLLRMQRCTRCSILPGTPLAVSFKHSVGDESRVSRIRQLGNVCAWVCTVFIREPGC